MGVWERGEMAYTVLIVEDDAPTRTRLAEAVGAHPELRVVGQAGDFAGGLDLLRATVPDVLLVDLGLPDESGVRLIRAAREFGGETQAMVITVFADEKHVVEAIQAGAGGYLLKDGSAAYLARSILQLVAGGSPMSAPIARYLLRYFQAPEDAGDQRSPPAPRLTPREGEVLKLLAKGFTFDEIAGVLEISSHTVTTHVRHIYRKLQVSSRSEAVYEAASLGLIDLGD
jgi:DNA-binding NarL/FixJ family response regulator